MMNLPESKESGDQYDQLNGPRSSIIIFNKNNTNLNDSDEHLETGQMNPEPDMIVNVLEVEKEKQYFHGSLKDGDLDDYDFQQKISTKNLMNQQFDRKIVHCNPINNAAANDDDNNDEIGGSDQKQPNLTTVFDKSQSINGMMMPERGPNQLAYNQSECQCDACCKTMATMMMVIMTKFQSIFHWKTVININTDNNHKTNLDINDNNLNTSINYENDNKISKNNFYNNYNHHHYERLIPKRKKNQICCNCSNHDDYLENSANCSKTIKRATKPAQASNLRNVLCWTLLFLFLSSLNSSILNSYVTAISTPSYQLKQQRNFPSSHHLRSSSGSAFPQSSSSSSSLSPKPAIYHLHDRLYPFERANQLKQQMDQMNPSCPNCRLKLNRTQAENMKLYAIKQQILSKLNLEFRPNITTDNTGVAKEEALEIIRKAKLDSMFNTQNPSSHGKRSRHRRHRRRESGGDQHIIQKLIQWKTNNNQLMDDVDGNSDDQDDNNDNQDSDGPINDEYFGKTSEIIMFAKPEPNLNGHVLVKVMAPENFYKLNVSKAILWLRLLLNRRKLMRFTDEQRMQLLKQNAKIYLFKVANSSSMATESSSSSIKLLQQRIVPRSFGFRSNSSGAILDGGDDQQPLSQSNPRLSFQLLAIHKLNKLRHGWIKLNLTTAIHEWFDQAILQRQKTLLLNQQQGQQEQETQFNRTKSSGNRYFSNSGQPSPSAHRELTLLIDCVGCNDLLDIDLGYNDTATITDSARTKSRPTTAQRRITNLNNHHHHHLNKQALSSSSSLAKKSPRKASKNKRHQRRFRPFMVLNTEIRRKRRQRRHAYNCEDGIRQCCKQSLYVNFEELGWNDWIIFPRGYQANYCMGECVQMRTPDMMAYFHSHVLEEYRIKNPYASIAPCCAPTKLSSISLIYFDQNRHIIKADLPKMIVNECGCT